MISEASLVYNQVLQGLLRRKFLETSWVVEKPTLVDMVIHSDLSNDHNL